MARTIQKTYEYTEFPYVQSKEQRNGEIKRHPVVVVGGGPIGLTAGLDLAAQGISVIVLDDNNTVSLGSRAVCYAKRPLEIWDRLGCAKPMVEKGISWNIGRVFTQDKLAYQFNLLPEQHHKMPSMINLQQYYLEEYLVTQVGQNQNIDLRWKHKVTGLEDKGDYVCLTVETPDGEFTMEADWVIACDGANSDVRDMVGAEFTGKFFMDRFLIADVVMKADFPTERWFWFDAPFHRNQSTLLHKQSDNVWRIDFQLGWDADPEEEQKPENVIPRIRAMLGEDTDFELEWVSVYQFACRRIDKFRYNRVLFAGDSAHQVSPFGARGANTGVQDVDNLAWKLKLILDEKAPVDFIDSYHQERAFAADDNILNSTRSTDFMTPKSEGSKNFRDAVLELAEDYAFARPLVNSGRLSMPTPYLDSGYVTQDQDDFGTNMLPGTNCADAPVEVDGKQSWLLNNIGGEFNLLIFGDNSAVETVEYRGVTAKPIVVGRDMIDTKGVMAERYEAADGAVYLIRPDQHVAARWREFDKTKIQQALARATGQ